MRWAVVILAVASIAVGLALGNQLDVFWKAATICLECIGIAQTPRPTRALPTRCPVAPRKAVLSPRPALFPPCPSGPAASAWRSRQQRRSFSTATSRVLPRARYSPAPPRLYACRCSTATRARGPWAPAPSARFKTRWAACGATSPSTYWAALCSLASCWDALSAGSCAPSASCRTCSTRYPSASSGFRAVSTERCAGSSMSCSSASWCSSRSP